VTGTPALPAWLEQLAATANSDDIAELVRFRVPAMPEGPTRAAAVLVLFGPADPATSSAAEGDVLLIERAADLRAHAGQPAFPGGAVDPGDDGAVGAALREANEETGLDPAGIDVFAVLPALPLPVSAFVVTPVLGWWREPSEVEARDPAEVSAVHRVPIAQLVDPANRLRMRYPSGFVGPAFEVAGMTVWGFTAGVLDRLFALAGWERPWDPTRVTEMPQDAHRDAPIVDEREGGAA
jgi:8-oxo-dGTP pyrophosphatase MutT (NUDIX family)